MTSGERTEEWYQHTTKYHYQDELTAVEYSRRQSWRVSPIDWLIGTLEVRQIVKSLMRLGKETGGSVLDVPAGAGKITPTLSSRFDRYVAGDISSAMLVLIPGHVERQVMDATRLPFQDKSFEVVVSLRLLHRVPANLVERMIAEAARVASDGIVVSYAGHARPGALVRLAKRLINRPDNAYTSFAKNEFANLATARGAIVVRDRSISAGLTTERIATLVPAGRP